MLKHAMAQTAGRLVGQPVQVVEAEWISPRLRRVQLAGDALRALDWRPGDKIKLHVGEGQMRSYTPARLDTVAGTLDLIFHVHGGGQASDWAARGGEESFFFGPAPSVSLPPVEAERLWLLGDETTLGLFLALAEAFAGEVRGAVELAAEDLGAVAALGLTLQALPRGEAHGASLLEQVRAARPSPEGAVAVISGEATSVLGARDALLAAGWSKAQIRAKPYWSLRGKAHRKQLERGALQG